MSPASSVLTPSFAPMKTINRMRRNHARPLQNASLFPEFRSTRNRTGSDPTWGALGIVLATTISAVVFKEPLNAMVVAGVIICIIGVLLVNMGTAR